MLKRWLLFSSDLGSLLSGLDDSCATEILFHWLGYLLFLDGEFWILSPVATSYPSVSLAISNRKRI